MERAAFRDESSSRSEIAARCSALPAVTPSGHDHEPTGSILACSVRLELWRFSRLLCWKTRRIGAFAPATAGRVQLAFILSAITLAGVQLTARTRLARYHWLAVDSCRGGTAA